VRHVLLTFGVDVYDDEGRLFITERLADAGVTLDRSLLGLREGDSVRLFMRERAWDEGLHPGPIIRSTVEHSGGRYRTDVPSLLNWFDRRQLTPQAREEVGSALAEVRVGIQPNLALLERDDPVELFLLDQAPRRVPWTGWALIVIGLAAIVLTIIIIISLG
jgi:hypothetical protein